MQDPLVGFCVCPACELQEGGQLVSFSWPTRLETKQNKIKCWYAELWQTETDVMRGKMTALLQLYCCSDYKKTQQINHQYGFVCRVKQLHCIVHWRPRTYFRSVTLEKLKIFPKLPLIFFYFILSVLFSTQLKAETRIFFSSLEKFYFVELDIFFIRLSL